ncbi:DUF6290 family protein [Loigolactobacillus backii]|uniref:DUF6290 family protein n=1 Tax=Loigolactobacillus backii TaxID=375175 RepID=UPI0022FD7410|nr:DUF6290 family protein [Loigolactobacillus backii]MDA5386701.1 DUF6290 family protein [Loigolactobacillus backii]MDA5389226.1 DUF6290 family protein [Loigolactobacillus backii]
MATFYDISLSNLVLTYSIDQLEDEYDEQSAAIALKHWRMDGKRTVSMKDSLAELAGL